ncbi:MAG: hypothetical protein ACR2N3_07580 [Pyrinomonadaceae bacterium]
MKRSLALISLVFLAFAFQIQAQKNRRPQIITKKPVAAQPPRENMNTAIVVDERLAVLRSEPSLYAMPVQRMRRGRILAISGSKEADGVTFYRVIIPPSNYAWVQSEAVVGKFRRGDEERLARLIQASEGFDQIERAMLFLGNFPQSQLRPAMLLLTGDLIESNAQKISLEAAKKLDKREMSASGAPIHSFYLNYVSLDRFRKLGINFLFNPATRNFYYNGAAWKEIVEKFPKASESAEAQKRLAALKEKMEQTK